MQSPYSRIILLTLLLSGVAAAAPVWRSEFGTDGNPDGVIVIANGPSKAQISGALGGFLTVTNWDNGESAYTPDKAGRPLGATKGGGDSFSALYRFQWTTLNATETHAYEFAGFLGNVTPQTRQVLGALLRHWKAGGTYYLALDLAAGSVGNTGFGYLSGPTINLGSNPTSTTYQLAIGYNGATHVLSLGFFSAAGASLGGITADLDTDVPGLKQPGPPSAEYNAFVLTALGWEDYTGSALNIATVWKVDDLSYFDTSSGAFDTVDGSDPQTGACCLPSGVCEDGQAQSACQDLGGTWQGGGTACADVSCPQPTTGACCALDGTCSTTTASACSGVWKGVGTTCAQSTCTPYNPDDEPWEVVYDGVDSAADNVPNYLRWDSAIDDDWNQPNCTFRLNTPSAGFMSVDRVTSPGDHIKTGNIWIRDPILSYAAGFTMEVRVQIKPNSNLNAFSMTYLDNGTSFGVHLSPSQIKAGNLAAGGGGTTVGFNTTDAFHLYRLVSLPGSRTLRVYVDNNPTPVLTGSGDMSYLVGSSAYLLYPRILIGDNENNTIYNANYTLDFARYRRGATAPGQTPPSFPARVLPPFPPPAQPTEAWPHSYDGNGLPSGDWILGGGGAWTQQPDSVMELSTLGGPANARLDNVPGWPNRGAVTIEARIKVLPDSQAGGFNLIVNDQVGDTSLVLSTSQAVLMHSGMAVGVAAVPMVTTDGFHVYRLTREADSLYWHLYIDNNRRAAVAHQHTAGNQLSFSRIWFGDVGYPIQNNGCHVLIDYIRWHSGSNAPYNPCNVPFADVDGDRDVDQEDFAVFQRCLSESFIGMPPGCTCHDADANGVVDSLDTNTFTGCMSGPGVSASPSCAP